MICARNDLKFRFSTEGAGVIIYRGASDRKGEGCHQLGHGPGYATDAGLMDPLRIHLLSPLIFCLRWLSRIIVMDSFLLPDLKRRVFGFDISTLERFMLTANPRLGHRFLHCLPWPSLVNLSSTSYLMREIVKHYRERFWNVDNFFDLWFEDTVTQFRSILAFTGAIATGCQVLRFFDRDPPDERSHLDIVTRVGGVGALVVYLEGIGFCRTADAPCSLSNSYNTMSHVFQLTSNPAFRDRSSSNGILSVLEFRRPIGAGSTFWSGPTYDRSASIQLIVVAQDPVYHMLMHFHSSGSYFGRPFQTF